MSATASPKVSVIVPVPVRKMPFAMAQASFQ